MTSLNPLPPSKRGKNRYLVYHVRSEEPVTGEGIGKAVWKTALEFLGELGVSRSGLRIVEFDEKAQKGIVKADRSSVEEARAVLALVKQAGGERVALNVLGVSGILKKARAKWL